jgi:pimeloyl-ACP methyl ester carboxylesterase
MSKILAGDLTMHVQRMMPEVPPADGPAPIVVFIHGLLIDSLASYYFSLGPAFAAVGIDVIMYDLRGHGRTDRPASGYRLEDFVSDLDALLCELNVTEPVHLVGNSFGGAIAFGFAAAYPDRVATVTSIEGEPPAESWINNMKYILDRAKVELAQEETLAWFETEHGVHQARVFRAVGQFVAKTTIADDIPASDRLDEDLSKVTCPVFAIFGGDSDLSEQVPWLESSLRSCRTVVIPGQGHSVLVQKTAQTTELIVNWVREYARGARAEAK